MLTPASKLPVWGKHLLHLMVLMTICMNHFLCMHLDPYLCTHRKITSCVWSSCSQGPSTRAGSTCVVQSHWLQPVWCSCAYSARMGDQRKLGPRQVVNTLGSWGSLPSALSKKSQSWTFLRPIRRQHPRSLCEAGKGRLKNLGPWPWVQVLVWWWWWTWERGRKLRFS